MGEGFNEWLWDSGGDDKPCQEANAPGCRASSLVLIHGVARGVGVKFSLGGHTLLGDNFSEHVGQKVGAVDPAIFGNQVHASENKANAVHHAVIHLFAVEVHLYTDAPRRQALGCAHRDHTLRALDQGELDQFTEIVQLSGQQFLKPRGQDTFAVVVAESVGLMDGLAHGLAFVVQRQHGLLARCGRARFQGLHGIHAKRPGVVAAVVTRVP